MQAVSPCRSLTGSSFPVYAVDMNFFEVGSDVVLAALFLASRCTLAGGEFRVEDLFWKAGIGIAWSVHLSWCLMMVVMMLSVFVSSKMLVLVLFSS